jgi:hypothetical protein
VAKVDDIENIVVPVPLDDRPIVGDPDAVTVAPL